MATIYDVAKRAKVSPSTVSRIINGERNVAPATAEAVEKAIAAVGYVKRAVRPGPKPSARAGVKTGMIDFLSLGSHSPAEMFSLPAFSKLMDGDGMPNFSEFHAGTNPTNSASVLRVAGAAPQDGEVIVGWPAVDGKKYDVWTKASLIDDAWTLYESDIPAADPACVSTVRTDNATGYRG